MFVALAQGEFWPLPEEPAKPSAMELQRAGERAAGTTEAAQLKVYWPTIKTTMPSLSTLGRDLATLESEYERARVTAEMLRRPDLAAKALAGRQRTRGLFERWKPVGEALRRWVSTWESLAAATGEFYWLGDLAVLPLIPIAAIGAAALVAGTGLALLKEYARERAILADVKAGVISAEEAARILQAGAPPKAPLTATMENLPVIIAVGAAAIAGLWLLTSQ